MRVKTKKKEQKQHFKHVLQTKVAGFPVATLLKKRYRHRCFPVNFAEFLRTPFLHNTSGQLLLKKHSS